MTKRPNWSGVIVRNFDYVFSLRLVLVTAISVATMGTGESFAQARRFAFSPSKNSTQNAQLQGPQPAVNTPLPNTAAGLQTADEQFMDRLNRAIAITSKRTLTADSHSPWQIFHSILALRNDCQLRLGKEKVNAIEWFSTAEPKFAGEPWMLLTPHGAKFHPYTQKFFFEGHPGQFLALLSQSNLPLEHQFKVQGKIVTLNDVVNNTKKEVNSQEEVTWVLWGLQHFLKSDETWVNQKNEPWGIEKLVKMESEAAVVGTPCGGNHRLFALTRARDKYLKNGGKLRGVWLQADQKIKQHIEIARSLQNSDGSFSADSYAGAKHTTDVNLRFNTTGHTMEFLSISLPKERLNETWVRNAVWMLSNELIYHQNNVIDAGPLFHTLDALILYRDRIRPAVPGTAPDPSTIPPKIASALPQLPSGTALKSLPDGTIVPGMPKLIPDTESKVSTETGPSVPIPLPNTETEVVPELKSDSKVSTDPKSSDSGIKPMPSRAVSSRKDPLKVDPSQIPDIGPPAPNPRVADNRLLPPRSLNRENTPNAAPALLPETFAKPLLISESKTENIASTRTASKKTGGHPLADDSVSTESDGCGSNSSNDPVSALKPSNL